MIPEDIKRISEHILRIKGDLYFGKQSESHGSARQNYLQHTDEFVRLLAASVAVNQHSIDIPESAWEIIRSAISRRRVGGSYPQALFWEAMLFCDKSQLDVNALLDLVEHCVTNPYTERTNVIALLHVLQSRGISRAGDLIEVYAKT